MGWLFLLWGWGPRLHQLPEMVWVPLKRLFTVFSETKQKKTYQLSMFGICVGKETTKNFLGMNKYGCREKIGGGWLVFTSFAELGFY